MPTAAIVCEYNPFHNGHLFQIREIRRRLGEDCCIVSVMSGNYTQRGDAAILDKYSRAEAAVRSGVSLVLELPFPYSASSAEFFADSAIHIIDSLGIVDFVCFGCENDNIDKLHIVSERLNSEEFLSFRKKISEGTHRASGHAAITEAAYRSLYGDDGADMLSMPNNTLALEYLRALKKRKSKVRPIAIERRGSDHNSEEIIQGYSSASAIRRAILAGEIENAMGAVPSECAVLYRAAISEGRMPADTNLLSSAVLAFLRIARPERLSSLHELGGGIGYRLCECAKSAKTLNELFELAATKKYTHAKIRRAVICAVFGITSSDVKAPPRYTQLLAMDELGRAALRSVKKSSKISILTKPADYRKLDEAARLQAEISYRADSIYSLMLRLPDASLDFLRCSPYRKTVGKDDNLNV